jgi:hypothetical protein
MEYKVSLIMEHKVSLIMEYHNESVNGINDNSQQSIVTFDAAEGDGRTPDALVKLLKTNKTTVTTLFPFTLSLWFSCWLASQTRNDLIKS